MFNTCISWINHIICVVFLQERPQFLPQFKNPCWVVAGNLKCLPYFYIIGVCKTGTSDLFRRISLHWQVVLNKGIMGKETWFWTWRRYGHGNLYFLSSAYDPLVFPILCIIIHLVPHATYIIYSIYVCMCWEYQYTVNWTTEKGDIKRLDRYIYIFFK